MKKIGLPKNIYNWISLIGITIALISLFMIGFLAVISVFFDQGGSYLGLFMWIVLPVFLVIGLVLIPIGMYRTHKRDKKNNTLKNKMWPSIDLNIAKVRNAAIIFIFGSIFFLLLSALGSYEAFHYTESVEFCGKICHNVMKPEYIAYQNSSHAKVSCVECHVGSGADWYVRSKLSGLYQVYAVTTGNFPKPIPTPVHNLRPAQETCEECHWPEKFYSRQLVMNKHYLPDEANTEWDITLQMKIGPAYSALGLKEGIHWHINPDIKVEYIAIDSVRDHIPWIRYTNRKTGEIHIFEDNDNPIDIKLMDQYEIRTMDCIDCHNRPSHDYQTPIIFINDAITAGKIPNELPDIKYLAMEILGRQFSSTDSAMDYIRDEIYNYYEIMYEDIFTNQKTMLDQTISSIQEAFKKNIFPEMKVSWNAYHNHIGHLEFKGCFRCHDDKHSNLQGDQIRMDCNLCHTIVAQGVPDTLQLGSIYKPLDFVHPNDPNDGWKDELCSDCHRDLYQQ